MAASARTPALSDGPGARGARAKGARRATRARAVVRWESPAGAGPRRREQAAGAL